MDSGRKKKGRREWKWVRKEKKSGCDSTHTQTQVAGSSSCLKKEKLKDPDCSSSSFPFGILPIHELTTGVGVERERPALHFKSSPCMHPAAAAAKSSSSPHQKKGTDRHTHTSECTHYRLPRLLLLHFGPVLCTREQRAYQSLAERERERGLARAKFNHTDQYDQAKCRLSHQRPTLTLAVLLSLSLANGDLV